ncbi:hypothetical protein KCP75_02955 [Salmonella enterica subsp. enterica]|nr:hypothetical protein KCP75_02955 [Salmonella enterica subsp. enterica]
MTIFALRAKRLFNMLTKRCTGNIFIGKRKLPHGIYVARRLRQRRVSGASVGRVAPAARFAPAPGGTHDASQLRS